MQIGRRIRDGGRISSIRWDPLKLLCDVFCGGRQEDASLQPLKQSPLAVVSARQSPAWSPSGRRSCVNVNPELRSSARASRRSALSFFTRRRSTRNLSLELNCVQVRHVQAYDSRSVPSRACRSAKRVRVDFRSAAGHDARVLRFVLLINRELAPGLPWAP